MNSKNIKNIFKTALVVLFGNALYAFTVTFFVEPSGLVLGGFTGLSIAINHYVSINVSYIVLFFHLTVFIIGAIVLGKHFAISTVASTLLYPFFLNISEIIAKQIELPFIDILPINAVIAAFLIGISLGVLTRNKTSTGGTEVIPLVVNKLTGKSVGFVLFIIDGLIMLVQLLYSDIIHILYGILTVAIYSVVVHFIGKIKK
ncbi:MAG: YitT family protein [Ruminococcus sp.]|nr:YitT family protein [Ruminococcus sp.]